MKEIVVYTGNKCHACHAYKDLLNKNNVSYIEKSIVNEEYLKELSDFGISSIPFTVIYNDEVLEQAFVGLRDPKTFI